MVDQFVLSGVSFGEPAYLWLLIAPLQLLLLWVHRVGGRRADRRRYRETRALPVRETYAAMGGLAFWLVLICATSLCIVALARPQTRVSSARNRPADIVLLQDGSASMYARDLAPDRWQRSVRFLRAFAETLNWQGDRVALALFAHLAAPQLRLTRDPNSMFFFLDNLDERSPFRLEDNSTWDTNIEEGVYWGIKLIDEDERMFGESGNPRAFVVVSDGQAWSGQVATALAAAQQRGVQVHVVGVGTVGGALIPEPPDVRGVRPPPTIRARLDRDSLEAIARAGGGTYFEIGRRSDREIAVEILSSVRGRAGAMQTEERYEDTYWPFLFAAALCLCLGTCLLTDRTLLWWNTAGVLGTALLIGLVAR